MKILVINCGSSSIKYKLYDMAKPGEVAAGLIERIGEAQSRTTHSVGGRKVERSDRIGDHDQGVQQIVELLTTVGDPPPLRDPQEIDGVGHRVVHGGEDFHESVMVDGSVLASIQACCELAPLHNPANLGGIEAVMHILPDKPQVAVFDTAYFQTMPPASYHYAVPYEWYECKRIRRYGFHGTSHRYVAMRAAQLLGNDQPNLITLHLGNGCSMACIRAGKAVDQTMGLTPLEGLVMGTRSGDFDPAIIFHLTREGMSLDAVRAALEKQSGLLGLSGVSRDLRDVHEAALDGNQRAALAIDVFAHRAKKYVGAFLAELGTCHAVVFTGGIGENAVFMREKILDGLAPLGIELDKARNAQRSGEPFAITSDASRTAAWVIPTNEELMIARDTVELINARAGVRAGG
ncbi:MAG: acetate kinase [Phycisphaerales bacterium]|nr:MAG: acetate kinase [Phycisphaerales bacterium]